MKRDKASDKGIRDMLWNELKEYEPTIIDMTASEQRELHEWVKAGNSVYDNPYLICSDDGWPMDYINASRFADDMVGDTCL